MPGISTARAGLQRSIRRGGPDLAQGIGAATPGRKAAEPFLPPCCRWEVQSRASSPRAGEHRRGAVAPYAHDQVRNGVLPLGRSRDLTPDASLQVTAQVKISAYRVRIPYLPRTAWLSSSDDLCGVAGDARRGEAAGHVPIRDWLVGRDGEHRRAAAEQDNRDSGRDYHRRASLGSLRRSADQSLRAGGVQPSACEPAEPACARDGSNSCLASG